MKRNVVEMVLGAVVLFIAGYFLIFSYNAADLTPEENGYKVKASFPDIGSLSNGSDVRMSGVKIGSVVSLDLNYDSFQAEVTMSLNSGIALPEDSNAVIGSEGLLGGNYVALEPGGAEDIIPNGGYVQYTQGAQNLEKLLGKFIFSLSSDKEEDGQSL